MKKTFVDPICEVVRFGHDDVVCTSVCCDVEGIVFPTNDEVCPGGDAECDVYCV